MATSNDLPSPGSQFLQTDDAFDDELRQADDEDWPTLISSADPGPQDHVQSTAQADADEAILKSIVSAVSSQSSQQASKQPPQQASVVVLTRPTSSDDNPAAGFSFTKAKPMQKLNFRGQKQAPIVLEPPDLSRPVSKPTEIPSNQLPPLPVPETAIQKILDIRVRQSPTPEHQNASLLKGSISVQSPDATLATSRPYNDPAPITTSGPIRLSFPSTRTSPDGVSAAANDPLPVANLNGTKEPGVLNIVIPDRSKHTKTAFSPIDSPVVVAGVVGDQRFNVQNGSRKALKDPLTAMAGAPRFTKPRRNTKYGPVKDGPQPSSISKAGYTEDDLLRLLMYRRKQGQEELENFRATQQQKEQEIIKLHETSSHLSSQLQEVIQREAQTTAELSILKANKPVWESKIKRLGDYVKGLTNDHKRLREDADDLHKHHGDMVTVREELHNTINDVQESLKQERIKVQQLQNRAHQEINTLVQTVQNQNQRIQSDESLLAAERERSRQIEVQIFEITTSHNQSLELFTSHSDAITRKIDDLLRQSQTAVPPNKDPESPSHDLIIPMLEQCVGMLQKLHKEETVRPEDLQKINDAMDNYVQGMTLSVEACEESFTSIEAGQKQHVLAIQDQIRALSGNILSEHALSEQIIDLREMRATVRERLQATESSLKDARQDIVALRLRDEKQSRKIVALETDIAKAQSQAAEVPQALFRIQELDSRNKDLQSELAASRQEATNLSSQLQQSSIEAKNVMERLATVQETVERTSEEAAKLREEKSTSEKEATFEREQLRKELSKAAKMQLAQLQSDHLNVVQQLKLEKSPAEEKLKKVNTQLNMLKSDKEKSDKEITQLQASLKAAQSDKEAVVGTRKALQLHLKEMEARMLEKNNEQRDLQAMLNEAKDQVTAKDQEITALRASLAKRASSLRTIEQDDVARGEKLIDNGRGLRRDSRHASLDQSPASRPTTSKSSRHFTKERPVVEDSQPTEQPTFVSLDDLMLDDPFAEYAQEGPQTIGPQTIAGEDIAHLFPSTPGARSVAKAFDYTRKSVFQTTTVSEMQRRHHQSARESTPHTSTHIAKDFNKQSQADAYSRNGQIGVRPGTSVTSSSHKVTSTRRDPKDPSSKASIARESTQPQRSVKDPKQAKRNSIAAGFNDMNPLARSSKMQKPEVTQQGQVLGRVIEDSQSPRLNGRSRKMTNRRSSAPRGEAPFPGLEDVLKGVAIVDKFTRRFAQS